MSSRKQAKHSTPEFCSAEHRAFMDLLRRDPALRCVRDAMAALALQSKSSSASSLPASVQRLLAIVRNNAAPPPPHPPRVREAATRVLSLVLNDEDFHPERALFPAGAVPLACDAFAAEAALGAGCDVRVARNLANCVADAALNPHLTAADARFTAAPMAAALRLLRVCGGECDVVGKESVALSRACCRVVMALARSPFGTGEPFVAECAADAAEAMPALAKLVRTLDFDVGSIELQSGLNSESLAYGAATMLAAMVQMCPRLAASARAVVPALSESMRACTLEMTRVGIAAAVAAVCGTNLSLRTPLADGDVANEVDLLRECAAVLVRLLKRKKSGSRPHFLPDVVWALEILVRDTAPGAVMVAEVLQNSPKGLEGLAELAGKNLPFGMGEKLLRVLTLSLIERFELRYAVAPHWPALFASLRDRYLAGAEPGMENMGWELSCIICHLDKRDVQRVVPREFALKLMARMNGVLGPSEMQQLCAIFGMDSPPPHEDVPSPTTAAMAQALRARAEYYDLGRDGQNAVCAAHPVAALVPCPVCGKPATLRCSRCRSVQYCSPECQRVDWKKHKPAASIIRGTTVLQKSSAVSGNPVIVSLFRLNGTASLSDWAVNSARPFAQRKVLPSECTTVESKVVCPFAFGALPSGNYSVVAWTDVSGDGALHTELFAPLGWCATETSGPIARLSVGGSDTVECSAALWWSHAWPTVPASAANGKLFDIDGIHVLHTWGTPAERGYAHGFLLAKQIIDWFRFYVLERQVKSAANFDKIVLPWLRKFIAVPGELEQEVRGILAGMLAALSPEEAVIPELGRKVSFMEVLAVTTYGEDAWPIKHKEGSSSSGACTQFVFWGSKWTGGETIAARNMDGEIDLRRVTVTHLLVHASEPPQGSSERRVASVLWPGFVGTLSGVDEAGNYAMENAGPLSRNYTSVAGCTPAPWYIGSMLRTMPQEHFARPADAEKWLLANFAGMGGGVTPGGSILVIASNTTGFIYEADRYGGVMRTENMAAPFIPGVVMTSNHFFLYGAGPEGWNFGQQASFSSLWRYAAGRYKVEAWDDAGIIVNEQRARELLQLVCEGETEHSIVWRPKTRTLSVAVATAEARMWNAPYGHWASLPFDSLFV